MSPWVYLFQYPYPTTQEEDTPVGIRIQLSHQVLRDAPGFSHGEVSRCLRSRQSIWCSPQGWDTPGFSHGEDVTQAFRLLCTVADRGCG